MSDVKKNALKIQELDRADELREHRQKILADMYRYDWRSQLSEKMTTAGMSMAVFDAEGDVALVTLPNTTISDADNLQPYQDYEDPDYAITAQSQSLGRIDASKYDTLKLTISGSFNTRTVDGSSLTDTVSIGVKINGTYGGNYLAQGLGAGTHVISIPKRFQKSNIRFDALKVHAIQGVSTPTSITNVQLQRRTPMNVFVSLDDPEASSFVGSNLGGNEEKRKRFKDQLESGNEWMQRNGLDPSKTSPGDIALDTIPYEEPSPGPGGYKPPGSYDPNKFYDLQNDPSQFPSPNLPSTGPGRSSAPNSDTMVAANQGPSTPVKQYDGKFMPNPGGGRPGKIRLKGKAKLA